MLIAPLKTSEIIEQVGHRPSELPMVTWKYYQEWNNVIFLHWKVDFDSLVNLLPKGLELELFGGESWVSLVAFSMEKVRLRNFPSFSPVSNFHEVNIRTYVRYKGKSGVYFLSIEGAKWLSCKIAKSMSGLPYRFSIMNRTINSFESKNSISGTKLNLKYSVGELRKDKSDLDLWLTEKYALFQEGKSGMTEFDIHHLPWDILNIDTLEVKINYPKFQQYFNSPPNKIHYSQGVQVLAWAGNEKK